MTMFILASPNFALLENMLSTSVIYDFLHRFLTDVESADVECIIVNIGFFYNIGYLNN